MVVTDDQLDAVLLVDLATGTRTVLSSSTLGGGPALVDPQGIELDLLRNRALVLDHGRAELMAVDLVTGVRSTLSGETVGSGVSLASARRIALDPRRDRALVTLEAEPVVLAVDLSSGTRTVLSGGASGSGPSFVAPASLVVDVPLDRALVTDPGAGAVFEVELGTGDRQVLSSNPTWSEPDWSAPAGVAVRPGGVPLVIDSSLGALIEVGPSRRRIVSRVTIGSGPTLQKPVDLDVSHLLPEHLVVAGPTKVFRVDVSDGAREPLGAFRASAVAVSRGPRACITVIDPDLPGLVHVMPSGNRETISGEWDGLGPLFTAPRCLVLEPSVVECSNAAYVVDKPPGEPATILRVDLSTGARSIVADATEGWGLDIDDPVAIEVDLRPNDLFLFVLDAAHAAIHSVGRFTGQRAVAFLPELPGTPADLFREEEGFLVTVSDPPALFAVREQSATVLSNEFVGAGPALGRPAAVEVVASASVGSVPPMEVVYVLSARGAVLAIDRTTGDRLIRSK